MNTRRNIMKTKKNNNAKGHHTGLASEFHVLSILNRLQIDCYLTLGNAKSIDIVINEPRHFTIDSKGTRIGEWLMGNKEPYVSDNHFYALVHYKGKIEDPEKLPDTYIVPSSKIKTFLAPKSTKGYGIYYNDDTRKRMKSYLNNWAPFKKK
jgi:hypothetical protein